MAEETHSSPEGTLHTETGVDPHHGEAKVFSPFDASTFPSQLLWLAITFGLLYYLMAKVALPRISNILEVRHDRIADDLSEAERLKQETDDAIAAYEHALADAKSKAHSIAQGTRDAIASDIAEKREAVDAEMAEKTAAAETEINAMREAALGNVNEIAAEAAGAIVKQLIGTEVSAKDLSAAVKSATKS